MTTLIRDFVVTTIMVVIMGVWVVALWFMICLVFQTVSP